MHIYKTDQLVEELEVNQKVIALATEMNTILNLLLDEISDLEDGIINALHHQISPKLLPPDIVKQILKDMKQRLPRYLVPAVTNSHLAEFYFLPIRLFINQTKITFLTNIPAYNPHSILHLYRHVDIPIWSSKHNVTISMHSSNPFLAINVDKTLHRELSIAEVEECQRIENLYLCPHLRVLYRDERSCLKALYLNDILHSHQICEIYLSKESTAMVTELTNNQFVVLAPKEERANLMCPEEKDNFIFTKGMNQLNLSTDCVLSTPSFVINTLPEPIDFLSIHLHPVTIAQLSDIDTLLKHRIMKIHKKVTAEELLETLHATLDSTQHISIDQLITAANEAKETVNHTHIWTAISLASLALLTTTELVIWLMYCYSLYRKRYGKQETATHTHIRYGSEFMSDIPEGFETLLSSAKPSTASQEIELKEQEEPRTTTSTTSIESRPNPTFEGERSSVGGVYSVSTSTIQGAHTQCRKRQLSQTS